MPNKKTKHKCPLCKSPLTKIKYDQITGIWTEREKLNQKMKKDLQDEKQKRISEKKKHGELLQKQKTKQKEQEKKRIDLAIKKEKRNSEQTTRLEKQKNIAEKKRIASDRKKDQKKARKQIKAEKQKKIAEIKKIKERDEKKTERLHQRIKLLEMEKKAKNEVDLGFAQEKKLFSELKKIFPADIIINTGKKGDILHKVKKGNEIIGTIVYECKERRKHSSDHITRTRRAQSQRKADFAVLVTAGKTTKNFKGFKLEKNVIIIRQEAVTLIAKILRRFIVDKDKLNIKENKINKVASRALKFLRSNNFKIPLQNALQDLEDNQANLKKEKKTHEKLWDKREESYQLIHDNIELVVKNSFRTIKGDSLLDDISFSKTNKNIMSLSEAKRSILKKAK